MVRYLRTGNGKQIEMPEQGAQKMFDGLGPNNNGVSSFQGRNPDGFPPVVKLDGTVVGVPSHGGEEPFRGAAFITVYLDLGHP